MAMGAVPGSSEHMVLSMPVVKGKKGINNPICKKKCSKSLFIHQCVPFGL